MTEIEKDAEEILEKFSKTLDTIPDLEETYYITDNLNLNREDKSIHKMLLKLLETLKQIKMVML